MRVALATIVAILLTTTIHAEEAWFVGERGRLSLPLAACPSYEVWARFEILRYRELDIQAAIKFIDQQCPTVITGVVVIEEIAEPPSDLGMTTPAVCLRRVGDPGQCLWLDSGWLHKK